jgi:hypothetical protein
MTILKYLSRTLPLFEIEKSSETLLAKQDFYSFRLFGPEPVLICHISSCFKSHSSFLSRNSLILGRNINREALHYVIFHFTPVAPTHPNTCTLLSMLFSNVLNLLGLFCVVRDK